MSVFGDGTEGFRLFWTGDDETDCVEICRDLMSAGVEYRVSQEPVGLSGRMGVTWRFEIGVLVHNSNSPNKQRAGQWRKSRTIKDLNLTKIVELPSGLSTTTDEAPQSI